MSKLKPSESDACSNSESQPNKGTEKWKHIINAKPSATISTTKIQNIEPEETKEGECIFHSQMWVKGFMLQFIAIVGAK